MPGNRSDLDDELADLPPSARYVLDEFDEVGETLTLDELNEALCHRRRTIRGALKTLEDCRYLSRERANDDLRQVAATLDAEPPLNPSQSDT